MLNLDEILKKNKTWANDQKKKDPDFYKKLAQTHEPEILWIGCSDSRILAVNMMGAGPGEVFVHRNIANQVLPNDPNSNSAIEFCVNDLKVHHIIVCGHYECGGIKAAIEDKVGGFLNQWVSRIREQYFVYDPLIKQCNRDPYSVMSELNVLDQIITIVNSDTIQNAWKNGSDVTIHGLIYNIYEGLLEDLNIHIQKTDNSDQKIHQAFEAVLNKQN